MKKRTLRDADRTGNEALNDEREGVGKVVYPVYHFGPASEKWMVVHTNIREISPGDRG